MNDERRELGLEEAKPWLSNQLILERLDWQEVFGNKHPVEIELGAGDGGFILDYAQRHPERNFVATERLLGRARKIAKRVLRRELEQVRVLRLESAYFLKWMCPPASVTVLHIMFPDPWPKRRHHKNRLIQGDFLQIAHGVLVEGGEVRFTTDHEEYFAWACRVWEEQSLLFDKCGPWDASQDPKTDFERQFMDEGRSFQRCAWRKRTVPAACAQALTA
jgi:tRNA (guanine-N7-)-methyltransferase